MIKYLEGDLLQDKSDAIIVTVNCVGIMGKGIALDCKKKYPDVFAAYKTACANNLLKLGGPPIWIPLIETTNGKDKNKYKRRWIICFPTKDDWRNNSCLEKIRLSLQELGWQLENKGIKSIAVPPLGCGNGGLDWNDVEPLVEGYLNFPHLTVNIYPPLHYYHQSLYYKPLKV